MARRGRQRKRGGGRGRLLRWTLRALAGAAGLALALVLLYRVVNPPTTPYMFAEGRRLGGVAQQWTPADAMAPVMLRAVVAAEDANFCNHAGFDMAAIRLALDGGSRRGASTLSQQVVKNLYLWQGRSWLRKALETALTPLGELVWPKRRILELYLNVAEFGEGVFGIHAAAKAAFDTTPERLSAQQAALLASVLPDPKRRSAARPSAAMRKRAAQIQRGAETIRQDGRADCFQPRGG